MPTTVPMKEGFAPLLQSLPPATRTGEMPCSYHTPGEESGGLSQGTPDGVERNSERERRRRPEPGPSGVHSPLWQPLLGTALSRSGPEVFRLRQACPRSSGEGPGQHPRVSGPPGAPALLRDPNRRVGIVAVSLLLGRCRLFVLGHGLRGERSSDPSSGRVPPGPPRPPTDGATVLSPQFHKAGTPLGVAPIRRRTAPTSRCHPVPLSPSAPSAAAAASGRSLTPLRYVPHLWPSQHRGGLQQGSPGPLVPRLPQ
ncbi:hypothetical protein NDU88_001460 [Pleurodeles waltl]|uniref:Uncharacterized protein n=1 Tax=Pleurodeles waltl TaxID=8319 RepID=A0AAV7WIE0_PLEWA|nr:hypothetical protein NDU88_001460 [Pleurodeles waltl]